MHNIIVEQSKENFSFKKRSYDILHMASSSPSSSSASLAEDGRLTQESKVGEADLLIEPNFLVGAKKVTFDVVHRTQVSAYLLEDETGSNNHHHQHKIYPATMFGSDGNCGGRKNSTTRSSRTFSVKHPQTGICLLADADGGYSIPNGLNVEIEIVDNKGMDPDKKFVQQQVPPQGSAKIPLFSNETINTTSSSSGTKHKTAAAAETGTGASPSSSQGNKRGAGAASSVGKKRKSAEKTASGDHQSGGASPPENSQRQTLSKPPHSPHLMPTAAPRKENEAVYRNFSLDRDSSDSSDDE